MAETASDAGREEETKAPEEAGKEEKDEDAHEIMLDLGDAATHKASLAKEKEEDEVLMTIETPPSDTVSGIGTARGKRSCL